MGADPLSFFIITVCIIFIAILSGSEIAFISLNRIRLRHLVEKGNRNAKIAQRIRDEHDKLFSAVILSGNLFTVLASSIGTAVAIRLLGKDTGVVVATIAMTILTVVFGELAPKTFAVTHAEKMSLALARPIEIYIKLISPLVYIFNKMSNFIIRVFGGEVKPAPQLLTEDEMKAMIKIGEEDGTIEKEEKEMLHNIFAFGDQKVTEAMVQRTELVTIAE